ncbi:glycerol-3-phosphate dehydrogenase/oxidase [Pseudoclavibacter sp. VKM Ac-2867]|uniref:glycerol-3-phosphate dehydrogenase/oxidase n=1 Tax=Pseudoclavibacter sp. VKM Ac-2867 TaxID=2783829 RepID=UPI00188C027B|nr:glycerol-3-phosphate dehydrogenase/oxidase [Pseudoclavibacter sp. VKM Ac-2867]MBF4458431.1 glycerol-3-phosphate dehydrogenase/oxidase [Pseudoclavibacter sp. VKM Ac-2867]
MATTPNTSLRGGLPRASAGELASRTFDVIVVGAGINGAAVAREAALRGLSVALLERSDFGEGTSAWNSRLIHGGLRYLEHGEIPLVYESLHDREALLHIAPHLIEPMPFIVPLYKHNHLPGWMFRIGMILYDVLSLQKSLPSHRHLGVKELATEFPGLRRRGLGGGLHYYDAQIAYPERLVLETILSASEAGARVANYTSVERLVRDGTAVTGVEATDVTSGERFTVRGHTVVNAAGPWLDELSLPAGVKRQIGGTTGTHLVVDEFPGAPTATIYYEAFTDNRAILVIPWNGKYLIGTTDDRFEGDPGKARGTAAEVEYILKETNLVIPQAKLTKADVLYSYTGVRPLPFVDAAKTGAISRSHIITAHDDRLGLVSIVGGKLTPHLSLAKETVDLIASKLLGRKLPASGAAKAALPGASWSKWPSTSLRRANLRRELPWDEAISDRLVRVYGARALDIAALAAERPQLAKVIGDGPSAIVAAEIVFAIEQESAVHLSDILHRRTMVGLEADLAVSVAEESAAVAADAAGWSAERVTQELADHAAYITRFRGGLD